MTVLITNTEDRVRLMVKSTVDNAKLNKSTGERGGPFCNKYFYGNFRWVYLFNTF